MGTSTTAGAADGAGWNQWAQPTNGAGEACRSYPGCERCLLRSGPKERFRCWAMRGAGRPACLEPAALLGLQLKFLARTGGRDLQLQDFHSGFPALAPPNHGKLSASTSRRAEPPALAPSLVLSQLCRHHGAPLGHSAKYVTLPHVGHKDYELQNLTRAPAKSSARPRRCQHPCSTAPLTAPHCGSRLMPGSASQ